MNAPHLWEIEHPYYCSDTNYFSGDCSASFASWADFHEANEDADDDYNYLIRFDWRRPNSGWNESPQDFLDLFYVGQRKGVFRHVRVAVERTDEPAIRDWLRARYEYALSLWTPFSGDGPRSELPVPDDHIFPDPKDRRYGRCSSCDSEDVKVNRVEHGGPGMGSLEKKIFWFCDVCYGSPVGTAFLYPQQTDPETKKVLKTVAYAANLAAGAASRKP